MPHRNVTGEEIDVETVAGDRARREHCGPLRSDEGGSTGDIPTALVVHLDANGAADLARIRAADDGHEVAARVHDTRNGPDVIQAEQLRGAGARQAERRDQSCEDESDTGHDGSSWRPAAAAYLFGLAESGSAVAPALHVSPHTKTT